MRTSPNRISSLAAVSTVLALLMSSCQPDRPAQSVHPHSPPAAPDQTPDEPPPLTLTSPGALDQLLTVPKGRIHDLVLYWDVQDADLAKLPRVDGLHRLTVRFAKDVTDRGLDEIARMPELVSLHLQGAKVTAAGLQRLAAGGKLRDLRLLDLPLDRRAMAVIGGMSSLRSLKLFQCGVRNHDLEYLRMLRHLEVLEITEPITDSEAGHIAAIGSLEKLTLQCAAIGDEGLASLGKLSKVNELFLQTSRRLGAEGLSKVGLMPALERLTVVSEGLTEDALAGLRAARRLRMLTVAGMVLDGSGIGELNRLQDLEKISLGGNCLLKASGVTALSRLPGLRRLQSVCGQYDADCLKDIAKCRSLVELDLAGQDSDAPTAGSLAQSPSVRRIRLANFGRVGDLLSGLRGMQRLEEVSLKRCEATDADLAQVSTLQGLRCLAVSSTAVTDAGVEHLAGMRGLRVLDLSGNDIGDAAAAHLARIPTLRSVDLSSTKTTERGLAQLKALAGLESLYIYDTELSAASIEGLRRTLNATVVHGPRPDR